MPQHDSSRQRFLARQRAVNQRHWAASATSHEERYGSIAKTHLDVVHEMLAAVEPGRTILDAGCGTGKYFDVLSSAGHGVFGVDQSQEMLALARERRPDVPTERIAVQDLRGATRLHGRFGGLVCIDAMEWVLRDDWPAVLEGFRAVLIPGSPLYLNVEQPGEHERAAFADEAADGAAPGEVPVHDWFNHFPSRESVTGWLSDAGLLVVAEREGDCYWHVLMRA